MRSGRLFSDTSSGNWKSLVSIGKRDENELYRTLWQAMKDRMTFEFLYFIVWFSQNFYIRYIGEMCHYWVVTDGRFRLFGMYVYVYQAEDKEKPVVNKGDAASGIKELPYIKDLMLRGQMMAAQDVGNMMPKPKVEHESTGVQLADVLSHPDDKISAQQADHDDDDDDRDLIIPVAGQAQRDDPPHYRSHMDFLWKHSAGGLSAGESCGVFYLQVPVLSRPSYSLGYHMFVVGS